MLVATAMLGPIYALYVERIGGSLMESGITGSVFALAAGITTVLLAIWQTDTKGVKYMQEENGGAWEAINYFSTAIGAAIGGFVAKEFGFDTLFVMMSVLCFV